MKYIALGGATQAAQNITMLEDALAPGVSLSLSGFQRRYLNNGT